MYTTCISTGPSFDPPEVCRTPDVRSLELFSVLATSVCLEAFLCLNVFFVVSVFIYVVSIVNAKAQVV